LAQRTNGTLRQGVGGCRRETAALLTPSRRHR